ncbi:MAG: hypothetical protein RR291_02110 [Clostridia bacterium]
MSEKKGNIFDKLKNVKNKEIIIAVVLCVIVLIIFAYSFIKPTSASNNKTNLSFSEWNNNLEVKLSDTISCIKGVGTASVAISYKTGVEQIFAYESYKQTTGNVTTEKNEIVTSQGIPVVIKEIAPQISGVVIVAKGAGNAVVKMQIIEAITTLLNVDSDCVQVFTYKD